MASTTREPPARVTRAARENWSSLIDPRVINKTPHQKQALAIETGIIPGFHHGWHIAVRRGDLIVISRHIVALRSTAEIAAARLVRMVAS